MRSALATILVIALLAVLAYGVWRVIRAALRKPVDDRHPRWWVIPIAFVALFIGIAVVAPSDDNERATETDSASSQEPAEDVTETATPTATETATPTATPTAEPTPTAAEKARAARLRKEEAERERARARARREAKARAKQRARERQEARERRRADAIQRQRERNTAQLQAGVTCDELGETNILVIPGAEIDADGDGVGCED